MQKKQSLGPKNPIHCYLVTQAPFHTLRRLSFNVGGKQACRLAVLFIEDAPGGRMVNWDTREGRRGKGKEGAGRARAQSGKKYLLSFSAKTIDLTLEPDCDHAPCRHYKGK